MESETSELFFDLGQGRSLRTDSSVYSVGGSPTYGPEERNWLKGSPQPRAVPQAGLSPRQEAQRAAAGRGEASRLPHQTGGGLQQGEELGGEGGHEDG